MKFKHLLIYSLLAFTITSCSRKSDVMTPTPPVVTPPVVTPPASIPYSIEENFEYGSKTAYADDTVRLATGLWDFNDALIGNLAADVKDGNWCVRIRTGSLSMKFDISGLNTLYIKHAKYGTDGASTWQLMQSTDGGVTYTQVGKDIAENNTTLVVDSFKIATTGKIRFKISKLGTTRIDIDDIVFKGTGDPGVTVKIPDTPPADTTGTSKAATARGVTLGGMDVPPTSGDNSNLLFGNPSGATASIVTPDNYLIDQGYYVESYNGTKSEPNWVSWHLDNTNTTNATGRLDNFAAFTGIAPPAFYQVQSNSYSGSGFDRGHNCPSADRTSSINANSSTFLMTNMIPQAPQNNQKTWANLEDYLRDQLTAGNEVYIVMGSYGTGGTGSLGAANTINNGKVNVPSNVWKVAIILPVGDGDLMRVTASTRVIAVNTPNINTINSDWTKYITTVKVIETATGYNLFSNLPATVKAAIETKLDSGI